MRSKAPALLPIFRSGLQGRLLALLFTDPDRQWTVSELAQSVSAPLTSVQSEISRLIDGDVLASRKVGRSRLVGVNNTHPLRQPLAHIVLASFGPEPIIREEFGALGARHVVIFGSWAARLHGVAGKTPQDVDVLVIGDGLDRARVYAAAEQAERRIGKAVNPVMRDSHAWSHPDDDPLIQEILSGPYVVVSEVPREMVSP